VHKGPSPSSRLDCYNSLLYGVFNYLLQKVQSVPHAAARLITETRRCERITPVLQKLLKGRVQARVPGSPVLDWTDTVVFRHSAHALPLLAALSFDLRLRELCVVPGTHNSFRDRRFSKIFCCRPSAVGRLAITSAAGHKLQTF